MILFETFGLFIVLTLVGLPLAYGLLLATAGMIWWNNLGHPLTSVFLSYIGGVESFLLIAVPLFMLAGEILSHGGVGLRIVTFATKLLGFELGVTIHAGLPLITTTPAHGTAFDIAGKGVANPGPILAAWNLAARLASR